MSLIAPLTISQFRSKYDYLPRDDSECNTNVMVRGVLDATGEMANVSEPIRTEPLRIVIDTEKFPGVDWNEEIVVQGTPHRDKLNRLYLKVSHVFHPKP